MALHDRRVRHERLGDVAAVAVPTALALFLCFYEISSRSLWLDEAASVAIASQHGHALGSAIAHDGGNMSAYYLLLHVVIGVFGKGALAIRFTAALAGAAAEQPQAEHSGEAYGRRAGERGGEPDRERALAEHPDHHVQQ